VIVFPSIDFWLGNASEFEQKVTYSKHDLFSVFIAGKKVFILKGQCTVITVV
jgi:hypothetical protein